MIGSLLVYVFYPLSRYWFNRSPAVQRKDHLVDGTRGWDAGAVTARMFTQFQKTLPDLGLASGIDTKMETKERMKESNSEKGENMGRAKDKKQITTAQYGDTNIEVASKMGEVKEEEVEMQTKNGTHQERVEDNAQENTCPVQKTIRSPSLEESEAPSQNRLQQPHGPVEEHKDCWDKYDFLIPDITESSKRCEFASAHSEVHPKLSGECAEPYLPVAAGPGLTHAVQGPVLHFNAMYCYLPKHPLSAFEVEWRVWQEKCESVSTTTPSMKTFPMRSACMDFTVMSYNILADDLLQANLDLYTHCPWEVLDWNYRCMRILTEIQKWAPDILCLQEVQETHFYEHLYPALSRLGRSSTTAEHSCCSAAGERLPVYSLLVIDSGYSCVYKRRTGTKTDGCATCYHISCFTEVSVSALEFYRPETKLLDRHNVAIVLLLRPVAARGSSTEAPGPLLCVVNTHLLFNPRRGDVKLAQLAILLAEMDQVVQSLKARGMSCNLIMCGDFNSVPHMPLYQLITTGQLNYHGLPAWKISGQEDLSHRTSSHRLFAPLWPCSLGISESCQYATVAEDLQNQKSQKTGKRCYSHDFLLQMRFSPAACIRPLDLELIPGVTDNIPDPSTNNPTNYNRCFNHTLRHRLDLKSVYRHFLPNSGHPEVTTLHSGGGATVDYIFYSPRCNFSADQGGTPGFVGEGLKLTGSLSLLSEDVLWSLNGLPNLIMPSDHLSLLAKFQMDLA